MAPVNGAPGRVGPSIDGAAACDPGDEFAKRVDSRRTAIGSDLAPEPAGLLTAQEIAAIADVTARRVLELIAEPGRTFGLVGARELAKELGVSLDYVYAHAPELGAMRLGPGPKARIRFDLDRARESLEARQRRAKAKRPR